jgi:uncharacterized protein YfdQ (DUF2303 family)
MHTTESAAVAEIAHESTRFAQTLTDAPDKVIHNILRGDERTEILSLERYAAEPRRLRGTSTVTDPGSFLTLLGMGYHHNATIFADETRNTLTAIIGYPADWLDHRVVLQLTESDQFQRWSKKSGQFFDQITFAEMLEDAAADIHEPTAADMIELAQSFQAARQVVFESSNRLNNGAVSFRYHEEIDAKAGAAGLLEVPESFTLHIPVLRGGDYIEVTAKLRYRIERQSLRLGFKLPALDDLRLQAFATATGEVTAGLQDEHDHTVVFGPAPTAITPLP